MELGKEFPKLTEKERDALILVHPYLDGMTNGEAAAELGISVSALQERLCRAYKRIPWLKADMKMKREHITAIKQSIRRPSRFGDMSSISNDGTHDTFNDEVILRKF